jgi:hypothetical protein
VDLSQYDSYGEVNKSHQMVHPKLLTCIRMQVWGIQSQCDDSALGSLVFANSFIQVDSKNFINLTANVPVIQAWHTNANHYANTRVPILTEKNLDCEEHFGDRVRDDFYDDVFGFLPVQQKHLTTLKHDFLLFGKLMFYEKGFIYTDLRLGAFVVPYSQLQKITFHFNDTHDWIQFEMREGTDLLPAGLLCENKFYLHMKNSFCLERFQQWTKMFRN